MSTMYKYILIKRTVCQLEYGQTNIGTHNINKYPCMS